MVLVFWKMFGKHAPIFRLFSMKSFDKYFFVKRILSFWQISWIKEENVIFVLVLSISTLFLKTTSKWLVSFLIIYRSYRWISSLFFKNRRFWISFAVKDLDYLFSLLNLYLIISFWFLLKSQIKNSNISHLIIVYRKTYYDLIYMDIRSS